MGTLSGLADSIAKLNASLPGVVSEKVIEAANVIVGDLTQVTPVDTGTAISNWQVTLNAPAAVPTEAFAPSPRGRMINGVWTHTVPPEITRTANAPATIDAAKIVLSMRQPGQPIFITNALPYIGFLDAGSSEQTPAGFVDRAIILARELLDKIGIKL